MFTSEKGASEIVNKAVEDYERYFSKAFPLYEYIDLTKSANFDFSVEGSKRLAELISKCIKTNRPVETPSDYEERIY